MPPIYSNRPSGPLAGFFLFLVVISLYLTSATLINNHYPERYIALVSATVSNTTTVVPQVLVGSAGTTLTNWWNRLITLGISAWDTLASYGQVIARNWDRFLNGGNSNAVATNTNNNNSTSTATNLANTAPSLADREALKHEIETELTAQFNQQLKAIQAAAGNQNSGSPTQGIVVTPSSGNPETDSQTKSNIGNMFSDQVQVNIDSSGQSGIITPIFSSGHGSNYLFMLTPVKQ